MRFPKTKHAILGVVVILAAVAGVFALQLFTQTFPSITRPNPPPVLQTNCQTLVAANSTIPAVGTNGYVLFNCGGSTPAFKMLQNATVAPIFTLPAGYVGLWATASDCSNPTLVLQNGTPISLSAGTYSYCALTDTSTSTLATFSVTWEFGQKDNTSMSITCPSKISTGATLSCSVVVTDIVNSTIIPTGTVSFTSSDNTTGTVGPSCTLNSSGGCSISIHGVIDGGFTITGTYAGDAGHNGSSKTSATIIDLTPCNGICT